MRMIRYFFGFIPFFFLQFCLGQESAEIQGKLLDSARNLTIEAASVSLYKTNSEEVYRLALSSEDGQFVLQKVSRNQKYLLRVQHQRYETIEMEVVSNNLKSAIGNLYLQEKVNEIEEVAVLAPVRMNGDTIEFNADAFKLDSNAVAGDLLIKLPGITIWGDEEITYNGKKISNVLVNGKPFFSVSSKIALENLPKSSIEKVQIYDTEKDIKETKDINLVLKKGKDKGVFGKIGSGAAINKYYEGEAVLSAFNSANQLSLGTVVNNVNKPLKNMDMLMGNTGFGGITVKTDYFSDMRRLGDNKEMAFGTRYLHDFIPQSGIRKKNRIMQDVFYKYSNNLLNSQANISWLASEQSDNRTESVLTSDNLNKDFLYTFNYEYTNDYDTELSIKVNTQFQQDVQDKNLHTLSYINNIGYEENEFSSVYSKGRALRTETSYIYRLPSRSGRLRWFNDLKIDHKFNILQEEDNNTTQKNFYSSVASQPGRDFNRVYMRDGNRFNQDISAGIGELFPVFFGSRTKVGVSQALSMSVNRIDRKVLDTLRVNDRLSFFENYHRYNYRGTLSLRRDFVLGEVYRVFKKSLSLSGSASLNATQEKNESGYIGRDFRRNILTFNPSLGLSYQNMVEGESLWHIDFDWNNKLLIPTFDQLRPIVDDINLLNLYFGNPYLQNGRTNNLSLKYRNNSFGQLPKSLELLVSFDISNGAIMESVLFTNDGRREVHLKNNPESQTSYLSSLNYNKSFKFSEDKNMTVKFNLLGRLLYTNQELSNELYHTVAQIYSGGLDLGIQLSSNVRIGFREKADLYFQKISADYLPRFDNKVYDTNLSVAFKIFERITFNANASYLNILNSYERRGSIILNSSLNTRMLKGNNLEIKLSANDILNNNSGLFSVVNTNYINYGSNSIIKQYFLVSLAYFPRFF